jgi:hypothetical protein
MRQDGFNKNKSGLLLYCIGFDTPFFDMGYFRFYPRTLCKHSPGLKRKTPLIAG